MSLTDEEKAVLEKSAELWNAIIALTPMHASDNPEHMRDLHNIQNRLLARATKRDNPELFE